MFKILTLDDDPLAIQIIKTIIELNFKRYCLEFKTAMSLREAKLILSSNEPDLILLDIKLHHEDGFDLLNSEFNKKIEVVVISGSEVHAIQALRRSVFDYLIKPVKPSDLEMVFQRLYLKRTQASVTLPRESILSLEDKININSPEGIVPVSVSSISFIEADNLNTNVFLIDTSVVKCNKSLKYFEELLSPNIFYRVQKSYLINLNQIEKIIKSNGGSVVMKGSELMIPISKQIKREFYTLLKV